MIKTIGSVMIVVGLAMIFIGAEELYVGSYLLPPLKARIEHLEIQNERVETWVKFVENRLRDQRDEIRLLKIKSEDFIRQFDSYRQFQSQEHAKQIEASE